VKLRSKSLAAAVIVCAAAFSVGGLSTTAIAAEPATVTLPADQEAAVRAELDKYGTDPTTADALIAKFKSGEQWGNSSGSEPTGSREITTDGESYNVQTWPDGSFVATTIGGAASLESLGSKVDSGASTNAVGPGITGCSEGAGVGRFPYIGCTVKFSGANYGGSFNADFYLSEDRTNFPATITRVDTADYFAVAGVVGSDGQATPVRIVRPTEVGSTEAMAELTFLYSSTADVVGSSAAVRLYVGGLNARVSSP